MGKIFQDIVIISVLVACVVYFFLWRIFSKVGNSVENEIDKIKEEAHKEETVEHGHDKEDEQI